MTHLDIDYPLPAAAPIDVLEHYFGQHGWACERDGDEEISATISGSWANVQLKALWREDDRVLQLIALPDVQTPEDKRGAMYETIGRINEQLWIGHFEMWAADGTVVFRHAALLQPDADDDEADLTLGQAEALVEAAIDECERFHPVFQFVLWAGKTPAEAIAAALLDTVGEA